ncbi:MAG: response regulator transcription factor [Thermomicrobiales bacterium]
MRILIADDHPLFRDGVASLLRARGHDIVAVAENGKEAIDLTRALQPDLVLMDLRMPEIDGLTATRIISTEMPHIKIFIITVSDEDDDLYDAIKSGAAGYVIKNVPSEEFFELLDAVVQGKSGLPPALARKVLAEYTDDGRNDEDNGDAGSLTRRELDVLSLMVAGVTSTRDLADHLVISDNTVKYHLRNILNKLHLNNRAAVVAHAVRHGLVQARSTDQDS